MAKLQTLSRNFMKIWPVRKYADITARSNTYHTQPAASTPINISPTIWNYAHNDP